MISLANRRRLACLLATATLFPGFASATPPEGIEARIEAIRGCGRSLYWR